MNIRDLKYLVAVHDLSNFSKAAERCFVSQPTLSGQLKKLENELGSTLIERSTRQVLFTSVGNQVVSQAREVLQGVERIHRLAKQQDDPMVGEFHLGLIPTVGPFLLPMVMPKLQKIYPSMTIFIHDLKADILLEQMLRGELDAAIVSDYQSSAPISQRVLYREEMKLAVSANDSRIVSNAIEPNDVVDPSVLLGRSFLSLEDGHGLRKHTSQFCAQAGANERKSFRASSLDSLLHMVASGTDLALVPDFVSRQSVHGVEFRSIAGDAPKRDVVMVTRKKSARRNCLNKLANLIETSVAHACVSVN